MAKHLAFVIANLIYNSIILKPEIVTLGTTPERQLVEPIWM